MGCYANTGSDIDPKELLPTVLWGYHLLGWRANGQMEGKSGGSNSACGVEVGCHADTAGGVSQEQQLPNVL
jgi:hypothetical protein